MADNPLTEPERFQAWAEHPLTVAFRQYLTDFRLQMAMQWASGQSLTEADQRQAETLGDLVSLSVADVRAFYGLDEGEAQ